MRNFTCVCGQVLFFENTACTNCHRTLGYEPYQQNLLALEVPGDPNIVHPEWSDVGGIHYSLFANSSEHQVCNWLVTDTEFISHYARSHPLED